MARGRHFWDMMRTQWNMNKHLCVGLDTDYARIESSRFREGVYFRLMRANRVIIDETHDIVCAYKCNIAFYAAYGMEALRALLETIQYIQQHYPTIPIILDGKRGDIGNTNVMYDKEMFEYFKADACTANPYMGLDEFAPLLQREDKGIFMLCRTSNAGAAQLQTLQLAAQYGQKPLYAYIAAVCEKYNRNNNIGLVMGAPYTDDMQEVRRHTHLPFLVPGIGKQNGDIRAVVKHCGSSHYRRQLIMSSSSDIIYAKKPRTQALVADTAIRAALSSLT